MEKIHKFKKEVLTFNVYWMKDCYPGNPDYIGKDRDIEFKESVRKGNYEDHKGRLDKESYELMKEVVASDSVFHFYIETIGDIALNTIYDEAQFSIGNLSLDGLMYALQILESYNYNDFFEELDLLSSKFESGKTGKVDEYRFKAVFKKHFKYGLGAIGKISRMFLNSFRCELKKRIKYLEALKEDINKMIAIKMEGVDKPIAQAQTAEADLQFMPNSDFYNLNTRMLNNNTKDFDLYGILNNAFRYIDDHVEMKEYFKRKNENAKEKYHYKNDSFYKALLSVVIKEREVVCFVMNKLKADENKYYASSPSPIDKLPEVHYNFYELNLFNQIINEVLFEDSFRETVSITALNSSTTIPYKVKALFHLIEFLHSKINHFTKYNDVILEQTQLSYKKYGIGPLNYIEKIIDMPMIEKSIQSKNEVIYINIIEPIRTRTYSLKVCDWSISNSLWDWNIEDIEKLHENYHIEDVELIHEYEQKYTEYRKETNCDYGCVDFFCELDETLEHLFSFFREKKYEQITCQNNEENNPYKVSPKLGMVTKVDVEKLSQYFHPIFKGRGNNNYNYFSQLINDLSLLNNEKELGQVALMIHESKNINSQVPNEFAPWYRVFCKCVGGKEIYRKSHLRAPKERVKNIFNYIEPKIL